MLPRKVSILGPSWLQAPPVPGRNSIRDRFGVSSVLISWSGTKEDPVEADSMGRREEKSGCSDAHAHTLPVESFSQLAPDSAQAARQYR